MTDDSYHMPICIGIGIGISIGKIFSSVLGIEVSEKSGIGSPLVCGHCTCITVFKRSWLGLQINGFGLLVM